MSYYAEDYYYETNNFNMMVREFKNSLKESVKDEIKEELEKLRKENSELQVIKKQWNSLQTEHKLKLNELEKEKNKIEKSLHNKRLSEIMNDLKQVVYRIEYDRVRGDKCEKCNNNRQLIYITPLGREAKESCTCAEYNTVYRVAEAYLYSFNDDDNARKAYYLKNKNSIGNKFELYGFDDDDLLELKYLIKNEEELVNINNTYYNMFLTKELANKYIEILIKK